MRIAAGVRNFAWPMTTDQYIAYAVQALPGAGAADPARRDADGQHDHTLGGVDHASIQWLEDR